MPSGYEKSDDYGGAPPGRGAFIVSAIAVGVIIALALGALVISHRDGTS
jgi:hypothetical protein